MKIKRIKTLQVNSLKFKIKWDKDMDGASVSYFDELITIGTKAGEAYTFVSVCHEVMEIVAVEMNVRLKRPDCQSDYIFVYDHRQHDTMMFMFAGLIAQFIT